MMKRILAVILVCFLCFLTACDTQEPNTSVEESGQEHTEEDVEVSTLEMDEDGNLIHSETYPPVDESERQDSSAIMTDCSAYCVVTDDGKLYMGQDEFERYAPASITKVLTALVVCELAPMDQVVTVSEYALDTIAIASSGVTPSLKPGEKLTVEQLLYAMILPSTNAAAAVLAEACAGTQSGFARLMNTKAKSLGCQNSHFSNPHGLDAEDHYTCAYDMALIMRAAMMNEQCAKVLSTKNYTIPATEMSPARAMSMGHAMVNRSYYCEGAFAGKTGSTVNAGKTLVTAATRNGKTFYVCTLHSTSGMQYYDTDNVIRFAFARWTQTKTSLNRFIYDVKMTASNLQGATFSYKVAQPGLTGHAVFWNLQQGVNGATFVESIPVEPENSVTIPLPAYGTYHIQLFVRDLNGCETAYQMDLLHCGKRFTEGIQKWSGRSYAVDKNGWINVGLTEISDGAYCSGADGALVKGFCGGKFYAGDDYKLMKGWIEIGNDKFYLQSDGRITTGDYMIGGVLYHFNDSGRCLNQ